MRISRTEVILKYVNTTIYNIENEFENLNQKGIYEMNFNISSFMYTINQSQINFPNLHMDVSSVETDFIVEFVGKILKEKGYLIIYNTLDKNLIEIGLK